MTNDYNFGVILEDIDDKLVAILEGQTAMADVPGAIAVLQDDMSKVKTDVKVIKAVVGDQSRELKQFGSRLNGHAKR